MKIAVITGASSGIGAEFTTCLDKDEQFDELWVIARRKHRLESIQARAKVRVLPMDLTDESSFEEYERLLREVKPEVAVLVNAGGFGYFGPFEDGNFKDQLKMIDLNDRALVAMTYITLEYMERGSRIYNMGSMSAIQPVPYINVYGATKAFVLSFSRALNIELKNRDIRVMAVCPYWVKTEFFDTAVKDDTVSNFNKFYTPQQVVAKGRDVSFCGFGTKMQRTAVKLLPHKLIMKMWCRQQGITG